MAYGAGYDTGLERAALAQKEAAAPCDERAAFEKHYGPKDSFAWRKENGDYKISSLQVAWEIWQARAALAHPVAVDAPQGWISVQDRLPKCSKKPDSFGVQILVWPHVKEDGCADMVSAFYGKRTSDAPNFYLYGRVLNGITHWMLPPAAPVAAIDAQDGEATCD